MFQQDGSRPNISIRSKRANGGQAVHVLCGLGNSDLGTAVCTGCFSRDLGVPKNGVRSPGEQSLHWKNMMKSSGLNQFLDGHQEIHRLVFVQELPVLFEWCFCCRFCR